MKNKQGRIVVSLLVLTCLINIKAQSDRNFLSGNFTEQELNTFLIPQSDWHPFPLITEREEWSKVPDTLRILYIENGEQYLGKSWGELPATLFLEFVRTGNRTNYGKVLFQRRRQLASLLMAEIFENKGRFIDDIINGTWVICEESFWGIPAHLNHQKKGFGLPDITDPAVDLIAGETGALLAYVYYFLEDELNKVSPRITERIIEEEYRRIINPYLERDFRWEGRGKKKRVNNWNPWINSNVLTVALFTEQDNIKRSHIVYEIMQSIDVFINCYPEDGACDEGPGYWSHAAGSMFSALEILYSVSNGKINIYDKPIIKSMGQYIYKAWIANRYYINFADASTMVIPDAGLVYRYGKRVNDPMLAGFGALLGKQQNYSQNIIIPNLGSFNKVLPNLFTINEIKDAEIVEPFSSDIWMEDTEVMAARSFANSYEGLYIAAKGGNNAESHNHNDVGNFIIYCDGKPVIIDVGVGTYTKETFGKNRYDVWTMQSQYHNLPVINGVQQIKGLESSADDVKFFSDSNTVKFSLDITKCYPPEADIVYWKRNIDFIRNSKITLKEDYLLKEFKEPLKLNFMTPLICDVTTPGKIILSERADKSIQYKIIYNSKKFNAVVEKIKIDDEKLSPVWGNEIERIVLISLDEQIKGNISIEFSKNEQ